MIGTPGYGTQLEQENSKVLLHYRKLQANFAEVIGEARSCASSNEDIADKLSEMQEDMRAMGDYLSFQLQPKFYNQIRKEDSTIASQVFGIPELTELVLSFLDATNIMVIEQVNKTLRNIIEQSPKLQIALCLKPADKPDNFDARYTSPFGIIGLPRFRIEAGNEIEARFRRIETDDELHKVGPRWMKMLICQPPIKSLTVARVCASCSRVDRGWKETIESDTGLILRNLHQKAEELFAAPAPCETCRGYSHQHNGTPAPITATREVRFYG